MKFFKKLYHFIVIFMVILIAGCSWLNKPVETESGKELSKNFKAVYKVLESSKEFYVFALSVSGDAYKEGYLDESQKEEIIEVAKVYKSFHNDASEATEEWYDKIESGEDTQKARENTIKFLFKMTESGKTLSNLVEKYVEEKTDIPKEIVPSFFDIVQSLDPVIAE